MRFGAFRVSCGDRAALFLGILVAILGTASCKRAERAAPPVQAAVTPGSPAKITQGPMEKPSIRDTPEKGASPYSGLDSPHDAAVDDQGRLWVASTNNARIRVFDSNGGLLGGWGGKGEGPHALNGPDALAIHGDNLYVADTWSGKIRRFSLAGEPRGEVGTLYGPRGVAVGSDGRVWASDTGSNRISVFDANLANRKDIGKAGSRSGEFKNPVGIGVGPSGSVYVADTGNNRIVVLDAQGNFKTSLAVSGWESGWYGFIEIDRNEHLYVSFPGLKTVVELTRTGAVVRKWTSDSSGKSFGYPTGLALDQRQGQDLLYVIDSPSATVRRVNLSEPKKK